MNFDDLSDETPGPKKAVSFDELPDEAATAGPTPHARYRAGVSSLAQGSPDEAAGSGSPQPNLYQGEPAAEQLPGALAHQWGQVGKGVVKGVPAALSGGVLGDVEEGVRTLAKPLGVSPETYLPPTTQGGYLGPRGLGVMAPAANPEEAGGMQIGAMLVPGLKKLPGSLRAGPGTAKTAADLAPFEMHPDAPVGVVRPDSGARLLPADVPHNLPPESPTVVARTAPGATSDPVAVAQGAPARPGVGAAAANGPLAEVSPSTLDHMRQVLAEDGFTPYSLEQRLEEMSPHQFLGELSPNLEARMGGVASFPGASRTEIVNALTERGAETQQRMKSLFDQTFGAPQDLSQGRRILNIEQQRAAGPFYQAFKELSIPPTQEMMDLMPRLRAAGAFGQARRLAGIQGAPWTEAFDTMGAEGAQAAQHFPTAQSWDLVKQALDAKIEGSFNNFGEPTKWTRVYTGLKNDLIGAIDNHPDPTIGAVWREARNTFAGPAQIKDAQQLGKRILSENIDRNELPFMTASYSDAQMKALSDGIRADLENKLGRAGPQERRTINQILSPNNQQKLRWVVGDQAADNLFSGIEHEHSMWDAPQRIYKGSPTAAREAAKVDYAPKPGLISPENIGHVVSGAIHPVRTAGNVIYGAVGNNLVAARAAAASRLREEMSKLMTLQGPERDAVLEWLINSPQQGSRAVNRGFARGGKVALASLVDAAARMAKQPKSAAHAESGNYAKGHLVLHGLPVAIENARGSLRKGIGRGGKPWQTRMPAHYGYFKRSNGADGDEVDCYIGPDPHSRRVFVVDQHDAQTGKFDEHKCMLGFSGPGAARACYLSGFSDRKGGQRLGKMTEMTLDQLKERLAGDGFTKATARPRRQA